MTGIKINQLTKAYPESPLSAVRAMLFVTEESASVAVSKVDLEIGEGEILGIVGANGAGKSTLLQMIAGILAPTSGSMEIDGHVTAVFTLGTGLKDELTGRENIFVDGELNGLNRTQVESSLEEITAFAELGAFIDRPVRTYSTGMKSRLAFAMLTHIQPEILIIDEALSAGDIFFARKATKKIREICARGKIVIIVSHSLQTINEMCTRCLWMDKGKIILDGAPEAVTKSYFLASRQSSESALANQFSKINRSINSVSELKILKSEVRQNGAERKLVVNNTETEFLVEIDRSIGAPKNLDLHVRIERADGLLVEDHFQSLSNIGARLKIRGKVADLFLSGGLYVFRVSVLEGQNVLSEYNSAFEVQVEHSPSGGRPALIYPAYLEMMNSDRMPDART